MAGSGSAATQTPSSSASTSTLDEIAGGEKADMPIDTANDGLTQRDVEKAKEPQSPRSVVDVNDSLVEFDGPNDPDDPGNWSKGKRWAITISMALRTFVVSSTLRNLYRLRRTLAVTTEADNC